MPKKRPYPEHINSAVVDAAKDRKAGPIRLPLADYKSIDHRKIPPLVAIRSYCLDRMGGHQAEVERCTSVGCDLFMFRFGASAWVDDDARRKTVADDQPPLETARSPA